MPKSFYIIDGHAQIFRAYFAPFRELTSPAGEPTKATFVFIQMLLNLVDQRKPDYLAMVIDSSDETVFRKTIDPNYKANRTPPGDDFAPQADRILRVVADAGVPIFVKPGFEADDLIATMARRLEEGGFETFLISKDKDLRQVLTNHTKMYDPQSDQVIDPARLQELHGFTPAQAVEIQTLTGDATDNIPGIPGIGPKTAVKLIGKYGSADAILNHLEELTPKMRENFEKYAGRLPIARQLVTLKDDVEFDFDPADCAFGGFKAEALRAHLEELGFHTLLKRLGDDLSPSADERSADAPSPAIPSAVAPRPPAAEQGLFGAMEEVPTPASDTADGIDLETSAGCDYILVDTPDRFADFLKQLKQQKRFAFDTETDALGAMTANLVGMSFSWEPATGWYLPVRGPGGWRGPAMKGSQSWQAFILQALGPILQDPAIRKIGHNIKYDLLVMRRHGIRIAGLAMDTMVAAFLVDSGRFQYGIDLLARQLLQFKKVPTAELLGTGRKQISMDQVPLEQVARYAAEDADIALRLADHLQERLDELPAIRKLHDELETPLVEVLAEMEFNGVAVDPAILKEQSAALSERIDTLRARIMDSAGCNFNPDSPKQLADVLFNKLGLRTVKRTKTGYSTDVEVLEKLSADHECPRLILQYRSLVKLKNTYLDNLPNAINPATGRIHGSFNQSGAATGRLSMSDPNLQNIPIREDEGRRIRLAFVAGDPAKNVLLTADYSQVELRILAHFTGEPALVRAFEADEDIHRAVAAEVFGVPLAQVTREQRAQAKIVNFGIIYGVTPHGLARRIDGMDFRAAEKLIDNYNRRFPGIRQFMDQCVMTARQQGYVETILGRRRAITDVKSAVGSLQRAAERVAINSVIQGSAADLIKIAMLNIHRRLQRGEDSSRMLLQVHDELVFETPKDGIEAAAELIRHEMVHAMTLRIPLKVDVGWGKNWQEGK